MRRLALAAAVAALSLGGCYSYKPVTALDDEERAEISSLAARLGTRRVHVTSAGRNVSEHKESASAGRLAAALTAHGFPAVATSAAPDSEHVEVQVDGAYMESCASPLPVITAGVVPDCGRERREYRVRVVVPGSGEKTASHDVGRPYVWGWLASPVALLPGWRLAWMPRDAKADHTHEMDRVALVVARDVAEVLSAATDR